MIGDRIKALSGPVLITGHTGFKGTWLGILLDSLGISHTGFSLPPEPNSLFSRISSKSISPGTYGDIQNMNDIERCFEVTKPSIVIHLAAQPLVLHSYENPLYTFNVNTIGTANLLDVALKQRSVQMVLVITTDKVYKNSDSNDRFAERDTLGGDDPYSASKVAAETVCVTWRQLSKLRQGPPILVARAGNVVGGGDYARDRLIPDIIRSTIEQKVLDVRNPKATRPWQHVLDPLFGYLEFIETRLSGELGEVDVLNFGPFEKSLEVQEVLSIAKKFFKNSLSVSESSNSSLEKRFLDLDSRLAAKSIGWKPRWTQKEAINLTFNWWKEVLSGSTSALDKCREDIELYFNQ